jgi:hypothetical protein
VDDVVELEGVVRLREALQVQRVVLQEHQSTERRLELYSGRRRRGDEIGFGI